MWNIMLFIIFKILTKFYSLQNYNKGGLSPNPCEHKDPT